MMKNSKEKISCEAKKEGIKYKNIFASSGFKNNPRIVRVCGSFGGKDRHSKVCTIRGLRDRRIRLSIPTAIQLYDLQHKLQLPQPSKVIDWLLDVAKLDIDNLPPLPIPPGFPPFQYDHHHHHHHHQYSSTINYSSSNSSQFPPLPPAPIALDHNSSTLIGINNHTTSTIEKTKHCDSMDLARKGKWNIDHEDYNEQISSQKLLLSSMMNNKYCNAYNYNINYDQIVNNNNNNNHNNNYNNIGVINSSQNEASSSLLLTPYGPYMTNPFESQIHFLTSNSHHPPFTNSFMSSSSPFSPNYFNLMHLFHAHHPHDNSHGGSGKDGGAAGSSHRAAQSGQ